MDIASASNFERFMLDLCDRDTDVVRAFWEELARKGSFNTQRLGGYFGAGWRSGKTTESKVLATIASTYERYGIVIDPHTAVAMHVAMKYRERGIPMVIAETAQWIKFEDTIRDALGFVPERPERYRGIEDLPQFVHDVEPTADAVKAFIEKSLA